MVQLKYVHGILLALRRTYKAEEFQVLCLLLLVCGWFCCVDLRPCSDLCPLYPPFLSVFSQFLEMLVYFLHHKIENGHQ